MPETVAADLAAELTASLRQLGLAAADEQPVYSTLSGGVSSDIWRVDLRRGPICVKRALPKLRVKQDWFAPVERGEYEVRWFQTVGGFLPDAVPKLLGVDPAARLFAMDFLDPAQHRLWKNELRDGHADPAVAAAVATALVTIHATTAGDPKVAADFPTDSFFHALRLEPYLEATARRHPDLAARLHSVVYTTATTKRALVHGDVSPKNIMLGPKGPVFLDAETAWYGDPAFDVAFCMNHLLLKCLWTPAAAQGFLACFDAFRDAYMAGVSWESPDEFEGRAAALLPGLFLARVDGKSPVEYLTDEAPRERVRRVARALIESRVPRLADVRAAWAKELHLA